MNYKDEKYSYTYSAGENSEVEKIVDKYREKTPSETTAEKIKMLDRTVEKKATVKSVSVGVIGALLLGIGMCFTMVFTNLFVLGIIIGIVGIAVIVCAYPVYKKTVQKARKQVAPQILELSRQAQL